MKEEEEINGSTQICPILIKLQKQFNGGNGAGKTELREKKKLNLSFKAYTKINSKLRGFTM